MAGAGLIFGLLASIGFARAIAGLLFKVSPWNGEIFGIVTFVLVASALLAGSIPATRAARIDPAAALRIE